MLAGLDHQSATFAGDSLSHVPSENFFFKGDRQKQCKAPVKINCKFPTVSLFLIAAVKSKLGETRNPQNTLLIRKLQRCDV